MLVSTTSHSSSDLLATTLRSIGDAVITTDVEANITFLNPMAEHLTGWTDQEVRGVKSWQVFDLEHEHEPVRAKCPVEMVLETGTSTGYRNHTLLKAKDGSSRPVSYNATPLRDLQGNLQGVVLVFHCAQQREELRQNEERMQLVAKATNDAVWDWDLQAGKVWWNEAVTTLFDYNELDVQSSPEWFLGKIHPADRRRVEQQLEVAKNELRYWQQEYRFLHKDTTYSVVLERGYVLRDPVGNAVRLVGTIMDVTGRRLAQEELMRVNQALESQVEQRTEDLRRANRELESFSYSVSHDLRSPLRNIITLSRMIQDDNADLLNEDSQQSLKELVTNATRMSNLIQDMLQYSRLARTVIQPQVVSISDIAHAAASAVCDSNQTCIDSITIQPGLTAFADPALVMILFENLLGNAVKFTGKRERAAIEVGLIEERGEQVFYVRDNGVGFDPQLSHKLFVPFERLHSEQEFTGTGIGLANVARIVNRHNGRVWAKGAINEGATFFFTLSPS